MKSTVVPKVPSLTPEEAAAAAEFEPDMWRARVDTKGAPSGVEVLTISVWNNGVGGEQAFAVHVSGAMRSHDRNGEVLSACRATFEEACYAGRRLAVRVLAVGFAATKAEEVRSC